MLPLLLIPLWHLMSRAQDSLPLPIMSLEWKVHGRLHGAGDALPPKAFPELASYIVIPNPSLPQPGLQPTPQASEGSRGFTLLAFLSPRLIPLSSGFSAQTQTSYLLPRPKPKAFLTTAQAIGSTEAPGAQGSPTAIRAGARVHTVLCLQSQTPAPTGFGGIVL